MFVVALQHHLDDASGEEDPKVAFLVPTVSLVTQQTETFKTYLPSMKTVALCGDATSAKVSLGRLVPNNDVFVLTPQILVDALNEEQAEVDISSFSLLIFDECHHAVKGHPYSKVMAHYLDKKLEGSRSLPQVCLVRLHVQPRLQPIVEEQRKYSSCHGYLSFLVPICFLLMGTSMINHQWSLYGLIEPTATANMAIQDT